MKVKSLLILFLATVVSSFSLQAQDSRDYTECYNFATKQTSQGITIKEGNYSGYCYNDTMMRAIEILPLPKGLDSAQYLVVANFSHNNEYYYALIDMHSLRDDAPIYVQLERFTPRFIAGHSQIRYHFSKGGIKLYKSLKKLNCLEPPTLSLSNIVTSIEAMRPFGKEYGLLKGTQDKFIAVFRMKSLDDVIKKSMANDNNAVEQYLIKFENPANKKLMLRYFAEEGSESAYTLLYNTIKYNCTNGLYIQAKPIIKSVGKKLNTFQKWKLAFPAFAPKVLMKAGLLEKRAEDLVYDLEDPNSNN